MQVMHRLLTALVLIPFVLLTTFYLPTDRYAALLAVFIILGAWEWAGLSGYRSIPGKLGYVILVLIFMAGGFVWRDTPLAALLIALATLWWVVATLVILHQQRRARLHIWGGLVTGVAGLLILVPAWVSLVMLHGAPGQGPVYVIFLLTAIWLADAAAYFAGRRWGKTRLASVISPGKTWAGVVGGVLAGLMAGAVFALATGIQAADIIIFSLISGITVMGSIVGDLIESLAKRLAQVKDSGSIFPGHGGMLDRIDSLTAAAPIFLAALWLVRRLAG